MTNFKFLAILIMAFALAACTDKTISADSSITEKWNTAIGGESDHNHDWTTAYNLQLNIKADRGDTIRVVRTGQEKPTLIGYMAMQGNGVMKVKVPQDIEGSVGLICDSPSGRKYQRIYLGNEKNQEVDVDLQHDSNSSSPIASLSGGNKAATRVVSSPADTPLPNPTGTYSSQLNGYFNNVNEDDVTIFLQPYTELAGWTWEDVQKAFKNGALAEEANKEGTNFEFTSDGYISHNGFGNETCLRFVYCYGDLNYNNYSKNYSIGIYTHSDGTFSDLKLYTLYESRTDYLPWPGSYRSKIQYKLDGNDLWYDTNFCNDDGEGILLNDKNEPVTAVDKSYRNGDGVYGAPLVLNNYGSRITNLQGLTPQIYIKKGLKYGFYIKNIYGYSLSDEHKALLKEKGVPDNVINNLYSEIYFSNLELNVSNEICKNGKRIPYRCCFKKYGNYSFIGFDDYDAFDDKTFTKVGDGDCNDMVFCLMTGDGRPAPYGSEKYASDIWTYAYENLGTNGDFDFNDVVIRETINANGSETKAELMAAGCNYKTELIFSYKGYDQTICEVHEAFGLKANDEGLYSMVNTEANGIRKNPVDLGVFDTNFGYFKIKVYLPDGEIKTYSHYDKVGENGDVPTALIISGNWQWPLEKTNVFEAYPLIGKWAKDRDDTGHWFTQPKPGSVFK